MLIAKDKNEIMEAMAKSLSDDNYMNFEKTASNNENKVVGDHIKKLISVADELDRTGFVKEASQIDSIIQNIIKVAASTKENFSQLTPGQKDHVWPEWKKYFSQWGTNTFDDPWHSISSGQFPKAFQRERKINEYLKQNEEDRSYPKRKPSEKPGDFGPTRKDYESQNFQNWYNKKQDEAQNQNFQNWYGKKQDDATSASKAEAVRAAKIKKQRQLNRWYRSNAVKNVQKALGFKNPDGAWGPNTAKRWNAYIKNNNITGPYAVQANPNGMRYKDFDKKLVWAINNFGSPEAKKKVQETVGKGVDWAKKQISNRFNGKPTGNPMGGNIGRGSGGAGVQEGQMPI